MPVTFTKDEQFLIEQLSWSLQSIKAQDIDPIAALLVTHMNDLKFNKKLIKYVKELEKLDQTDAIQDAQLYSSIILAKFTYKTKGYESIQSIYRKIEINKNLKDKRLDIVEEEKLSLKEMGTLIQFANLSAERKANDLNKTLEYINQNCSNNAFKDLYKNISLSHSLVSDLQKEILKSQTYKTNDIAVDNINKSQATNSYEVALFDYDGPLAQLLLSDGYAHAAPLYVKEKDSKTKVKQSHITGKYENTNLEISDILIADTLRIDPCQLINKSLTENLEKLYGAEWQEKIRNKYQDISYGLHNNLELKNKEIENKKIEIDELNTTLEKSKSKLSDQLQKEESLQRIYDPENLGAESALNDITTAQEKIETLKKEINRLDLAIPEAIKAKETLSSTRIKNDLDMVQQPLKWFSPKAIVQGHTKIGHKNDFRKLSNEMFNPTENNKKMICSEFGAVTIAASIDQLNRIVALDLQAAGLIDKEQEIFKNPIPKNERINKIHPGRLVHLLKKAGAVEVRNETVDQYVKRNDLTSMETANIEKDLPNKILHLLKNSKDEQDFIDKANKNLEIYLEAYKVEQEVIEQIKKDSKTQFEDFYKRKNETGIITSIKKFCKGIAVSLHLRTKEKSTKKLSGNILTQVEKINKERENIANNMSNSVTVPGKAKTSVRIELGWQRNKNSPRTI